MRDRLQHDRRAALVDASERDLLLEAMKRLPADRTFLRRLHFSCAARPLVGEHVDDFRNDVATLFHQDRVADTHVLARQLVEVVQRRVDDLRPAEANRIELGDRSDGASASDIEIDGADDCLCGLGYDEIRPVLQRLAQSNSNFLIRSCGS